MDRAQRWTGRGVLFPWQLDRAALGIKKDNRLGMKESDLPFDVEGLSKRFEDLIDALCLRIATKNMTVDMFRKDVKVSWPQGEPELRSNKSGAPFVNSTMEMLRQGDSSHSGGNPSSVQGVLELSNKEAANLSHSMPQTPGKASDPISSEIHVIVPPFGSYGRLRDSREDEKDIVQWLCCAVVEPFFSKSLPRQCGIIRSRCFVPSTASMPTPLRPSDRRRQHNTTKRTTDKSSSMHHKSDENHSTKDRGVAQRKGSLTSKSAPQLQKALMDEDKKNLKRSKTLLAAKRQTTWDAREVHVRRRWDRSVSFGSCVLGSTPSEQNGELLEAFSKKPTLLPGDFPSEQTSRPFVRTQSEAASPFVRRSSQVLAMETPAKRKVAQWSQDPAEKSLNESCDIFSASPTKRPKGTNLFGSLAPKSATTPDLWDPFNAWSPGSASD